MLKSQQKNQSSHNLENRQQSSQLSKYMRKEDINFLYYITEQSVQDSGFDSVALKQFKFAQQSEKSSPQKNTCQIEKSRHEEFIKKSSQKSFSFSKSIMTPDQEFDKLLEITSRCIDYYNRFSEQKNMEFNIIQKTFKDLSFNLGSAFQEIIDQVQKKKEEISKYLQKKHKQILNHKNGQDQKLKLTLDEIKSVHLCNLLAQKQSIMMNSKENPNQNPKFNSLSNSYNNQHLQNQILQDKQKSLQLSIQLHNYATTLNKFYCLMEQIQTNSFKEIVEDCVNFINNLITQEIKSILYQKIPNKIQQKIYKGFMNSENIPDSSMNIFQRLLESTTKSLCSDSTDSLFKEINLKQMEQKFMDQGDQNINNCKVLMQKKFNEQNIQKGNEQKRENVNHGDYKKGQNLTNNNNKKFRPKILDLNLKANNNTPKKPQINIENCQNLPNSIKKQSFDQKHIEFNKFVQQICKTQQKRQKNIQNYNNTVQKSEKKLTQFSITQTKKIATPSRLSLKKEIKPSSKKQCYQKTFNENNENNYIGKSGNKNCTQMMVKQFSTRQNMLTENRQNISRNASKDRNRGIHHSGQKIVAHRIIQI